MRSSEFQQYEKSSALSKKKEERKKDTQTERYSNIVQNC